MPLSSMESIDGISSTMVDRNTEFFSNVLVAVKQYEILTMPNVVSTILSCALEHYLVILTLPEIFHVSKRI